MILFILLAFSCSKNNDKNKSGSLNSVLADIKAPEIIKKKPEAKKDEKKENEKKEDDKPNNKLTLELLLTNILTKATNRTYMFSKEDEELLEKDFNNSDISKEDLQKKVSINEQDASILQIVANSLSPKLIKKVLEIDKSNEIKKIIREQTLSKIASAIDNNKNTIIMNLDTVIGCLTLLFTEECDTINDKNAEIFNEIMDKLDYHGFPRCRDDSGKLKNNIYDLLILLAMENQEHNNGDKLGEIANLIGDILSKKKEIYPDSLFTLAFFIANAATEYNFMYKKPIFLAAVAANVASPFVGSEIDKKNKAEIERAKAVAKEIYNKLKNKSVNNYNIGDAILEKACLCQLEDIYRDKPSAKDGSDAKNLSPLDTKYFSFGSIEVQSVRKKRREEIKSRAQSIDKMLGTNINHNKISDDAIEVEKSKRDTEKS